MTYPNSSDVVAGQKTFATHYNNLRNDALFFGQAEADAISAGVFFERYAQNLTLVYAATNRVKIIFETNRPPRLVIGGCMLYNTVTKYTTTGALTGLRCCHLLRDCHPQLRSQDIRTFVRCFCRGQ